MGLAVDMGEEIGGWGLRGTMDAGGGTSDEKRRKFDRRDKWGQAVRNSLVVEMLSSRVNKVSSFQTRLLADCC